MKGIIGKKLGMTQIFAEDGTLVPVTVIQAGPVRVVQKKNRERDGYDALQLGFEEIKKQKKVNKPMMGHFKRTSVPPYRILKEIKMEGFNEGDEIRVDIFQKGEKVSVTGKSKGRGFQGVMKRHGFGGGPGSHGSMFNRAPGSIGQCSFPSRVFKNKRLPGHMGNTQVTIKNLEIVDIKTDQNLLLVKGAVPGANGGYVVIKSDASLPQKEEQ